MVRLSDFIVPAVISIGLRRRICAERQEGEMVRRLSMLAAMGLMAAAPGLAKGKSDKILPSYILEAHTVAVVVDPNAGVDIEDPRANQVAQKDVETELMNWGRYQPMIGPEKADLIIVIRKGHGRMVDQTINDPRQNNRAGAINPADNGMGVGAQNGHPPDLGATQDNSRQRPPQIPTTQTEVGGVDDSFMVFDGRTERPLDGAPGWRYLGQDGLRPHNVPAVDAFRKAVAAADKAAAAKKP
jgi:hypothetical protein